MTAHPHVDGQPTFEDMARRAREKDEVRRLPRTAASEPKAPREAEPGDQDTSTA